MVLAVPNFSEGRDGAVIESISAAFVARAELLDRHSDTVHNRSVLSLTAPADALRDALVDGARACIDRIDMRAHGGSHPCVGALDVCPVVWLSSSEQPDARRLAEAVASALAELGLPVFLYGMLAAEPQRVERAFFRQGGLAELSGRMRSGELHPDHGPPEPHPTAGATLVTARPPLAAFNVELDSADVEIARAVAAELRESGGGPAGVRAIGIHLGDRTQVSINVHDPISVPLGLVIERVRALAAAHGARPVAGEVIGLIPEAALAELSDDVPLLGFDPARQVLERRLGGAS